MKNGCNNVSKNRSFDALFDPFSYWISTDIDFKIFQFESMTTTPEGNVDMDIDSNGLGDTKSAKLEEQENGIGSLRSEAVRRKERLIELRKQAQNKNLPGTGLALKPEGDLPKPIFRNYNPISDDLKDGLLPERTMINCKSVGK